MQRPSVGRIVRYVLPDGPHAGASRPAIITELDGGDAVSLTAFLLPGDSYGLPEQAALLLSVSHVPQAEGLPGTWHWPPRD